MSEATRSDGLESALAYAAEGLRVIPLHTASGAACSCGDEDCASVAKHPRTQHGLKDASCNPETIRGWWNRWPDANVGVATGNGLLVIDVDGDRGCIALTDLCDAHGLLPATRCVTTGRDGGFHFWFRAHGPAVRGTTGDRGGIAPAIDTRGEGGYVVAPPSIHASGRRYRGEDIAIADAPQWLLELLTPKVVEQTAAAVAPTISTETTPYGKRAIELECEKVRTTRKGSRNEQLNASAYSLGQLESGGEIAYGDAGPALEDAALAAGLPSGQSWKTIYKSGLIKGRAAPRKAPESAARPRKATAERPQGAAGKAVEQIATRARALAQTGNQSALADVIVALGGDGQIAGSDPGAATKLVSELAQSAATRREGDRLARALRIATAAGATESIDRAIAS